MKTDCLVYLILSSCILAGAAAQSNETTGVLGIRNVYIQESAAVGQPLPVQIVISNDGPEDFNGPFLATLYDNGSQIGDQGVASLFLVSGESMEFSFEKPISFRAAGEHIVSVQISSNGSVFSEKTAVVMVGEETADFKVLDFKVEPRDIMADAPFDVIFEIESYANDTISLECSISVTRELDELSERISSEVTKKMRLVGDTFKIPPKSTRTYQFRGVHIRYPGYYFCNFSCSDKISMSDRSLELFVGGEMPQDKPGTQTLSAGSFESTTDLGERTPGGVVPSTNSEGAKSIVLLLVLGVIAAIAFGAIYYVEKRKRKAKTTEISEDLEEAIELERLKKKKDEIEEMIKIAKAKYYKRAMDEDVYKKIVGDNQNKLIEIEAKINEIEKRVEKLEGSIKKS